MENPPAPTPAGDAAADGTPALPTTPEAREAYIQAAQAKRDYPALNALFRAELLASPAWAEEMAAFDPRSHDSFANSYVVQKSTLYVMGPMLQKLQTIQFLELREAAAELLWEIQQKKLFDMQCRWRAEQLTLPGCRHTRDFVAWGTYIDHCPWLTPITAAEVAVYQDYLRSGTFRRRFDWWQNYDRFKQHDVDDADDVPYDTPGRRPTWYVFHDAHTAAGELRRLPDVRGEKEDYYVHLWQTEAHAEWERKREAGPEAHKLPWPPLRINDKDEFPRLIDRFEPAADLPRLHRWQQAVASNDIRREELFLEASSWYNRVLYAAGEAWPIAANADWRVALLDTAISYWGHQVAEVLPDVWQEQEQNRALGLSLTPPYNAKDRDPFTDPDGVRETAERTKAILRGRELAGEEPDFDF